MRRSTTRTTCRSSPRDRGITSRALGEPHDPAVPVRLWPELHHVRLLEPPGRPCAGQGRREHRQEHRRLCGRREHGPGDEVAQLYIHQRAGGASQPVGELKGFRRLGLQPGAKETVSFTIGSDELPYWSTAQGRWVQEAAMFDLWAGGDSTAALHAELTVVR